jgi:hypothetical protein
LLQSTPKLRNGEGSSVYPRLPSARSRQP